jgi:hypothetical protein
MSKSHQTVAYVVPGANPSPKFQERANRAVSSLNRSGSGSTIKADVRSVVAAPAATQIVDGLNFGGSVATSSEDFSLDALVTRAKEEGYNQVFLIVNPNA